MPVRIEATTMAAVAPMTMPSTVRKLRNLFERTLSSAIASVSRGRIFGNLIFIPIQQGYRLEAGYCPPSHQFPTSRLDAALVPTARTSLRSKKHLGGGGPPPNLLFCPCERGDFVPGGGFLSRGKNGKNSHHAR